MDVFTDMPAVQLYCGNALKGVNPGASGRKYGKREGFCLETQFYPDALHHPEWPQPFTRAGQHYYSETSYHFTW